MTKRDCFHAVLFLSLLLCIYLFFAYHFLSLTKKDRLAHQRLFHEFRQSTPDVLILGDSHVQTAIDPSLLGSKYFSFAQGGDNIRQMLLKLDYAIREKKTIRYVVIPGDYHIFSWYRNMNRNYSRELAYITNHVLIANLYNVNRTAVILRMLLHGAPLSTADDWEKYFYILTNHRQVAAPTNTNYDRLSQSEKKSLSMKRVRSQLGKKIVEPELVAVLDRLIDFCKDNELKIILVRYPFSKEYSYYAKKYPLDEVEAVFRNRAAHFLTLLNYKNIFFEKPHLFFDEDHLNDEGANVFTRIIKADIENSIFQGANIKPVLSGDRQCPIPATEKGRL